MTDYYVFLPLAFLSAVLAFVLLGLLVQNFALWIRCITTGAGISFLDLVGMRLKKVDARTVVQARIMAVKAGLRVPTGRLEAHYLAGGNVVKVVQGLVAAHRAGIDLDLDRASGIDLLGEDVLETVRMLAAREATGQYGEAAGAEQEELAQQ
jgi:uncharacterized protein YqfA (UPF0365 family)